MRRRDFLTLIGAAALGRTRIARAQQPLPIIGFLHSGSPGPFANVVAAFRDGLRDTGYAAGQNVRIDFRWAEGNYERLPGLAADLARAGLLVRGALGGTGHVAARPMSAPQCLHLVAAGFRSSDRHAGQVLVGGGSPKTVLPCRAMTAL